MVWYVPVPQVRPHPQGLGCVRHRDICSCGAGGSSHHPEPWRDGASFAEPCLCPALQSPARACPACPSEAEPRCPVSSRPSPADAVPLLCLTLSGPVPLGELCPATSTASDSAWDLGFGSVQAWHQQMLPAAWLQCLVLPKGTQSRLPGCFALSFSRSKCIWRLCKQ